ncbi:MAG: methyltransferase domain-containing protein [Deltaproteobacteria bacterium]|nr:methyltransferase domain-containing protein [Deltaproteobacteria bacterium]
MIGEAPIHRAERCPCCESPAPQTWPALVSPFIAEYVLQSPVSLCWLCECPSCGFRFFDHRYNETELARLYGKYRGPEYFQVRHKHEFWYTRRHNETHSADQTCAKARQQFLEAYLTLHLDTSGLGRILDYGGDRGQLIPSGMGTERHVFEVSDTEPVPGVRKISRETDLEPGSYDLVVLSHVLEHVPKPVPMLATLRDLLRPGSALYVEVPWERYSLRFTGATNYLRRLTQHPGLLRAADFYATAFRTTFGFIPPLGFPKLHEHINFFTPESLDRACRRAGLCLTTCEQKRLPRACGRVEVLSALARPS